MNRQFMCKKHRTQLEESPQTAAVIWMRLVNLARQQASGCQWQNAIKSYGNALEAAEIIFADTPESDAINRYIKTGAEFIYVLRQYDPRYSTKSVMQSIKKSLENGLYPADVSLLIKPLRDVSYAPIEQVQQWMKMLFMENQMPHHQWH